MLWPKDGKIQEYHDISDGGEIDITHTMLKRTIHIEIIDHSSHQGDGKNPSKIGINCHSQ
jgi:hypothetical protein